MRRPTRPSLRRRRRIPPNGGPAWVSISRSGNRSLSERWCSIAPMYRTLRPSPCKIAVLRRPDLQVLIGEQSVMRRTTMAQPDNGPRDGNADGRNCPSCCACCGAARRDGALPAKAQQIGTATAVNPLSESDGARRLDGHAQSRRPVVHKQRIHTTPSGSVQLLFLDKSTLSIAPNTNILVDEFVYDQNSVPATWRQADGRRSALSSAAISATRARPRSPRPPQLSAFVAAP